MLRARNENAPLEKARNGKGEEMKYQTAYFCGYAKLPSALPTTTTNGSITLGLKIDLETACIEDVSVTFSVESGAEHVQGVFCWKEYPA